MILSKSSRKLILDKSGQALKSTEGLTPYRQQMDTQKDMSTTKNKYL